MSKIEEEDGALLDEMASKFCKCLVEWWKPRGMGRAIDVNTIVSFFVLFPVCRLLMYKTRCLFILLYVSNIFL